MLEQENGVSRKRQQRQGVMNRLQPTFPIPLCCSGNGGGGRRVKSETEPVNKGGGREVVLVLF